MSKLICLMVEMRTFVGENKISIFNLRCKYVRKEITGCQTHQETFFFKTDIFPRKDALSCSMLARE